MVPHLSDERVLLDERLDLQRAAVAAILDDLSDAEARARLVPSLTTPLGLVRHAIFVEQVWIHSRLAGVPRAELAIPDTVDESFTLGADDTVASVRASYDAACARSRVITVDHHLDEELTWHERTVSLRFVYGHLIAELARHAGHGDILVEQVRAARGVPGEDGAGDQGPAASARSQTTGLSGSSS